jgi:hypothetical protein
MEYFMLDSTKQIFPQWKETSPLPEPYYISQTLLHKRGKVFAKNLNKTVSDVWRTEFLEEFQDPPQTRKDAFIIIADQDLNRARLIPDSSIYNFGYKI